MGDVFFLAIMFVGVAFLSLLSIKQIVILLAGTVVAAAVLLSALGVFVHAAYALAVFSEDLHHHRHELVDISRVTCRG